MYASDLKHSCASLEEKLHKLYTLDRNKKIDLSFRPPFLNLLKKFGNPHLNLPPVVHVAGTNGKGSVIAMLKSVLKAAGYKVHTYTSPHLIRFNERINLAGTPITNDELESLIDEALELNADAELTFFEVTTAIAFAAFARHPADICLLEVGMGGRLDCTNVIENPLLTIINTISNDHAEFLGETLIDIAGEKAGIIKPKAPCIIGKQNETAIQGGVLEVFAAKAETLAAPLHYTEQPGAEFKTALLGAHQNDNLAIVLKSLDLIKHDFPVPKTAIKKGLTAVQWPARLQKLGASAFGLPTNYEIFLDGGHNEDAGSALAAQAALWSQTDPKPLTVILGMMKGKDALSFMLPVLPFVKTFCLVDIKDEPHSQKAADLNGIFPQGQTYPSYKDALKALPPSESEERILICGSFYLSGHVLKDIEE